MDGICKPIEQVKQGDVVLSRDPTSGQVQAQSVVQTFTREVDATLVLRFDNGEEIETTLGHPFFVEGKGWTLAGELAIGNAVVTRAGPAACLVQKHNKTERTRVYNFEVADTHTYFVGTHDGGLWVHNLCVHNFKPGELQKHYDKHGLEFGPISKKQYLRAARSFLNTTADGVTILSKTRANGDHIMFNTVTNEFGVATASGYIRTYFIPNPAKHGYLTNLAYYLAQ